MIPLGVWDWHWLGWSITVVGLDVDDHPRATLLTLGPWCEEAAVNPLRCYAADYWPWYDMVWWDDDPPVAPAYQGQVWMRQEDEPCPRVGGIHNYGATFPHTATLSGSWDCPDGIVLCSAALWVGGLESVSGKGAGWAGLTIAEVAVKF